MGLFENTLKDSESLFLNEIALDPTFIPPIIEYRESQQKYIADCIKPLLMKRNGKNILITGAPGIGKTLATRVVLKELEEETDEIHIIYINCWKSNTAYKIVLDICELLDYKFTHNKTTEDLLKKISSILNKKAVVFCFDEVDKIDNPSILYNLIEDVYRKTIIMIVNDKSWLIKLDSRIKSRLMPEYLGFDAYNEKETFGILKKRTEFAFIPNSFSKEALELIYKRTYELGDIRVGIHLMKESGLIAESELSKRILEKHAEKALEKIKEFSIKNSKDLKEEENALLECIKKNPNLPSSKLHEVYNSLISYKTFRRQLEKLEKAKLIELESAALGIQGKTTIIKLKQEKTLDAFD
ncbi:AAA family ATPase [Candidatus Woesearchaeota archaeon]|nr:AAA family ATPase [Candidatus Woesearchaeota archaeon]